MSPSRLLFLVSVVGEACVISVIDAERNALRKAVGYNEAAFREAAGYGEATPCKNAKDTEDTNEGAAEGDEDGQENELPRTEAD